MEEVEGTIAGQGPTGRRQRNFSPWAQWMARLATTTAQDPLPVEDLTGFDQWRQRCFRRLCRLLGPLPERVPPDPETIDTVECDGYRREKVVFDTEATMSVPAYLLVPTTRRRPGPAVLAVHGHGPGKEAICGLDRSAPAGGEYAEQLVRRGYVVLAPDLRCFGERLDWNPPDHYACDTNLVHAVMAGWSPLTQNLWDLARSVDLLAEHPLVDAERIGVVGFSYGATLTLFLAAWDERVAAAVVSGYLSAWREAHKMPWNMCGSQVLPGMLGQLEHVDLGALVAPRPLLVETGTQDLLFPLAAASAAMDQLRPVYAHQGVPDGIEHAVFDGEHQWDGTVAYPFLDRWLGGDVTG